MNFYSFLLNYLLKTDVHEIKSIGNTEYVNKQYVK